MNTLDARAMALATLFDPTTPVYEHNSEYVYGYILAGSEPVLADLPGLQALVCDDAIGQAYFAPQITDGHALRAWLADHLSTLNHPRFKYLSAAQADQLCAELPGYLVRRPRSLREAFYDTQLLTELSGSQFAGLRQTRNRLLASGLVCFEQLSDRTLADALAVLQSWNTLRQDVYQKDRSHHEAAYLSYLTEHISDTYAVVAYYQDRPVGFGVLAPSTRADTGLLHIVKAINTVEQGGVRGASDAVYLHMFERAQQLGYQQLNDGDLGQEPGTIAHKLRFQPVAYTQTFDLELCHV